jgi:hypothetical protein
MEDRRIATTFLMSGSKDYVRSAVSIVQNLNCSLLSALHFLKERVFWSFSFLTVTFVWRNDACIHRPVCWLKAVSSTLLPHLPPWCQRYQCRRREGALMLSVLNPGRSDCNHSVYSLSFNPHIWQHINFVLLRSVYPFALLVKATKRNTVC